MVSSLRRRCSALLMAVLCATSPAAGQTEATTSASEVEAATEFAHGERAFALGQYELALRYFRNAERVAPRADTRFNIAVCLERLGRVKDASAIYRTLSGDQAFDEAGRENARHREQLARASLAKVRVSGRQVEVVLDDGSRCRAPCVLEADPGDRTLRVAGESAPFLLALGPGEIQDVQLPARRTRRAPPVPLPARERPVEPGWPGTLGFAGIGLTAAGAAGFTYFGLRTRSLHDDFTSRPTAELRDEGLRARTAANVSLGVVVVGVGLMVADWLVQPSRDSPHGRASR